jgi:hypothetical protein
VFALARRPGIIRGGRGIHRDPRHLDSLTGWHSGIVRSSRGKIDAAEIHLSIWITPASGARQLHIHGALLSTLYTLRQVEIQCIALADSGESSLECGRFIHLEAVAA